MGVVFKKNGRPTKKEKMLLKNINSHLHSLGDKSTEFNNETVTSGQRLEQIWADITSAPVEEIQSEPIEVKTEENNIKNNNMEEGAEIINEANEGMDTQNDGGIPSSFNPLSEPIVQRSYVANAQTDVGEIEEPTFEAQSSPQEQWSSPRSVKR